MSVSDREQLIEEIAQQNAVQVPLAAARFQTQRVFDALDRLGYSVTPAESPAEAPRIASAAPEGSEATHTAERPIAEIIGWMRCARCKDRPHWNIDDGAWGQERPIDEQPTVDDMLAWLSDQDWSISIYDDVIEGDSVNASIWVVDISHPGVASIIRQDQLLHGALELVVRAVAVETEETPR